VATWTKGSFYLQPGQSMTFEVSWKVGSDPGIQYVIARPWAPQTSSSRYEVTTETHGLASQLKSIYTSYFPYPYGGYGYGWPPPNPYQTEWTYIATFRNTGQHALWCELTGGEVG
jgi:hypothetical protein